MRETKQVIVMRRDLNQRRGKEVAQGSHASIAFLTKQIKNTKSRKHEIELSDEALQWLQTGVKKVCVRVNSQEELMEVYNGALKAGLETHLIVDSGRTEFHGNPTATCVSIGPNDAEKIDKITGHLEIY
jgi:peptidyl-tRNA hydrolase, PTH2 family